MNTIDLNKVKELFETQILELKKSLSLQKEGLSSLCWMINTDMWTWQVIFGITPELEVVGIQEGNLDNIQLGLAKEIQNRFEPRIIPDIQVLEYNQLKIIAIKASRSREVAYHEFDGRAFIREWSMTRRLTMDEKDNLSKKRNREKYNGPWKCDKCGMQVMTISAMAVTDQGLKKSFDCFCGGEFWPL